MPEEKEIIDKKEPGSCVVHDDTFGWGGHEDDINPSKEKVKVKEKEKIPTTDEPINWPYNKYR